MDKIIETPSGYKVTLQSFLTYDQFIELQKLWTKDMTFDPKNPNSEPEVGKISASIIYDANKLAVGFLVKKITDGEGITINRSPDSLPIPPVDGQFVMDEINRISSEATSAFDKKKVSSE